MCCSHSRLFIWSAPLNSFPSWPKHPRAGVNIAVLVSPPQVNGTAQQYWCVPKLLETDQGLGEGLTFIWFYKEDSAG